MEAKIINLPISELVKGIEPKNDKSLSDKTAINTLTKTELEEAEIVLQARLEKLKKQSLIKTPFTFYP